MTLTGHVDGADAASGVSYLEIAEISWRTVLRRVTILRNSDHATCST